jgi:5-methylcytosine-specific restriction enzyme subunit McrC
MNSCSMETIDFGEWSPSRVVRLSESEANALACHPRVFKLQRVGEARYRVGPRGGFVGACVVSRDRQVLIHPKVPIQNFCELLWLGHRLQPLPNLTTHAAYELGNASDWFSFLVLSEIESLIRGQLRNGYVEVTKPLEFLRGRVDFSRPIFASARMRCTYNSYQVDTPINRVIRGALELIASGPCRRDIRLKALDLLHGLTSVRYVRPSVHELDVISIDAVYSSYGPVLELIRLLFTGSGVEYKSGSTGAPGIFLQMDRIFERAMYASLIDALGAPLVIYQPELGKMIKHVGGSPDLGFSARPDVVTTKRPTAVIWRAPDAADFVIDAKYRRPIEQGRFRPSFRNANVYQIFTYAAALGCHGVLAYPKLDQDIQVSYRLGAVTFEIQTIDLSLPELSGLRAFASQFAKAKAA